MQENYLRLKEDLSKFEEFENASLVNEDIEIQKLTEYITEFQNKRKTKYVNKVS